MFARWFLALFLLSVTALAEDPSDSAFFSGARLGLTIDEVGAYYKQFENVAALWHSGAPAGEIQVDFRTSSFPQRRVYIYYRESDNKVVSVSYSKLGSGETFSEAERNDLLKLNSGQGDLKTVMDDTGSGAEFEVTTPEQYEIEAPAQQ